MTDVSSLFHTSYNIISPSPKDANRDIDARLFWRSVWNECVNNQLLSCSFTTTPDVVRFVGCGPDSCGEKTGIEFGGKLV